MKTATIPIAENLQELAALSRKEKKPILLMFSQDHCPFCHTLKEEILNPMQLNSKDRERVIMREVLIDAGETLIDFDGEQIASIELFHHYDMVVTPTIVLVDGSGEEIAERQVGVNTVEMYAWYLDNAINEAIEHIRGRKN